MKCKIINIKDVVRHDTLLTSDIIRNIEIEQEKELIGLMADEMRGFEPMSEYQDCQNCSSYTNLLDDTGLCETCKELNLEIKNKKRKFFVLGNDFEVTEEKYQELKKIAYKRMIEDVKIEIRENELQIKEIEKDNTRLKKFLSKHLRRENNKDE